MDPQNTGICARRRDPKGLDCGPSPDSACVDHRRQSKDSLLEDPILGIDVDLTSQSGLREHAKKKKKATAVPLNLGGGGDDKKDDNTSEGNNGAGGDNQGAGGDTGAGGGDGNGDGNDKKDNAGDNPDDEWATFTTAKSKKKGVDGGLPAIPTSDFGTDSFQEIKLGDDSAGKLDLGFGNSETKNGLGSWGTKWNGGGAGSGWDWGGAGGGGGDSKANNAAEGDTGEANGEDNPWSINRPKPKKKTGKTTFSFGSFDEPEGQAEEPASKPDDGWGFVSSKDKKKTSIWGTEADEKKDDNQDKSGAGADGWGWGTTKKKEPEPASAPPTDDWFTPAASKKDKKKKGSAMLLENTIEEPKEEKKEDDIWGTWGGATKKKEKQSTLLDDFGTSSTPAAPDPPPSEDIWGLAGSKDKKKKKKGGLFDDATDTPAAPDPPPATNMDDDFGWGFSTGKKKKHDLVEEISPEQEPEPEKNDDDFWSFSTKKTTKKTSIFADESPEPPNLEEVKKTADEWDLWDTGKKDSKKKNAVDDLIQLDDTPTGNASGGDDFFTSFGTGKKDKKFDLSWGDDTNDNTWDLGTKAKADETNG